MWVWILGGVGRGSLLGGEIVRKIWVFGSMERGFRPWLVSRRYEEMRNLREGEVLKDRPAEVSTWKLSAPVLITKF